MKIVINACYGGFSLSERACDRLKELGFGEFKPYDRLNGRRHDPLLVRVVEELGKEASGEVAELIVVEVDDGFGGCYRIAEYDGEETVKCDLRSICSKMEKEVTVDNLEAWRATLRKALVL